MISNPSFDKGAKEKMNVTKVNTYEELSEVAATILFEDVKANPSLNCCLATGNSPMGMYEKFVSKVTEQNFDVTALHWTKLDEWLGLPLVNHSTCEAFIEEHVFTPLNLGKQNFLSFNSEAKDLDAECIRIHHAIEERPLDICILGIGKNGHLGLNEPGIELEAFAHVVDLDSSSMTHSMLDNQKVTQGITLGLYEILNANKIIFLVSGDKKKEAFEIFMEQRISTEIPASFLWLHPNVELIVTSDIAE